MTVRNTTAKARQVIQCFVHRIGVQGYRAGHHVRKIKPSTAHEFDQQWEFVEQVVATTDDLGFSANQLSIRINCKGFICDAHQHCSSEYGQRLQRLLHRLVYAYPFANAYTCHAWPHLFDRACDLVPQRDREKSYRRDSSPVVHIGMADAGSFDAHEHVPIAHNG
jgi:hypothetical protein